MTTDPSAEISPDREVGPVASIARSDATEPFWRSMSEGRVTIPHCGRCGRPHFYPRRWCPFCWSGDIQWRDVDPVGKVWALSDVHLAFQGIADSDVPYTVVLVDLDAGVRLPGRLDRSSVPVAIGDRVRLVFGADPTEDLPTFQADPS